MEPTLGNNPLPNECPLAMTPLPHQDHKNPNTFKPRPDSHLSATNPRLNRTGP